MKQKIFGTDVEPSCLYCEMGRLSPDGDAVLCVKKGVKQPGSFCRHFRYDPLKRVPPAVPPLQAEGFLQEEFTL